MKITKGFIRISFGLLVGAWLLTISQPTRAIAAAKPSLKVISPADGQTITSADIPVTVEVSNFVLAPTRVGLPDKEGEGHIHVMLDGMNMGVLFNFFTAPSFTLLGDAVKPGPHTLIFDLATNTHEDMEDTVQQVKINYQPTNPKPAPAPINYSGPPSVRILSPANGATVGPKFEIQVQPTNFTPSLVLEGKPNLSGYGHYHAFVDMNMSATSSSGMMSMAGMVLMPGSNTFQVDLSAWPPGKHTITVEPVHNDHTPIEGAKEASITINLSAPTTLPTTGGEIKSPPALTIAAVAGVLLLAVGLGLTLNTLWRR